MLQVLVTATVETTPTMIFMLTVVSLKRALLLLMDDIGSKQKNSRNTRTLKLRQIGLFLILVRCETDTLEISRTVGRLGDVTDDRGLGFKSVRLRCHQTEMPGSQLLGLLIFHRSILSEALRFP